MVFVQLVVALDGPAGCNIWDHWRPHESIQNHLIITVSSWGNYDPLPGSLTLEGEAKLRQDGRP